MPAELKAGRRARFMETAAEISAERLKQKIGRKMPVLIDASIATVALPLRAPRSDAPEIDGTVRIDGVRRPPEI